VLFPHCPHGLSATDHRRTGRECYRISGVDRRDPSEIGLVALLKDSIHLAFAASTSAFCADAGPINANMNANTSAILLMTSSIF